MLSVVVGNHFDSPPLFLGRHPETQLEGTSQGHNFGSKP
jgi:hypothetical protein